VELASTFSARRCVPSRSLPSLEYKAVLALSSPMVGWYEDAKPGENHVWSDIHIRKPSSRVNRVPRIPHSIDDKPGADLWRNTFHVGRLNV
jgi:hypothetical protein